MRTLLVDQLPKAVNAKHAEALRAIELLAGYLVEESPVEADGHQKSPRRPSPRTGTGKIRTAVLEAFGREFLTIRDVAKETGFSVKQVRGVVMAPSLKSRFTRKAMEGGIKIYKYQPEEK
jgi:hypothetical protein